MRLFVQFRLCSSVGTAAPSRPRVPPTRFNVLSMAVTIWPYSRAAGRLPYTSLHLPTGRVRRGLLPRRSSTRRCRRPGSARPPRPPPRPRGRLYRLPMLCPTTRLRRCAFHRFIVCARGRGGCSRLRAAPQRAYSAGERRRRPGRRRPPVAPRVRCEQVVDCARAVSVPHARVPRRSNTVRRADDGGVLRGSRTQQSDL